MRQLLLDTSVIIDFLRRKDKEQTLLYKLTEESLSISIITHTELMAGKSIWENEQIRFAVMEVINGLNTFPLTHEVSEKAGQIKAKTGISLLDSIIAATSILNRLELVTLNTKDFKKIPDIQIYELP